MRTLEVVRWWLELAFGLLSLLRLVFPQRKRCCDEEQCAANAAADATCQGSCVVVVACWLSTDTTRCGRRCCGPSADHSTGACEGRGATWKRRACRAPGAGQGRRTRKVEVVGEKDRSANIGAVVGNEKYDVRQGHVDVADLAVPIM